LDLNLKEEENKRKGNYFFSSFSRIQMQDLVFEHGTFFTCQGNHHMTPPNIYKLHRFCRPD
jgi:hypothetical protein